MNTVKDTKALKRNRLTMFVIVGMLAAAIILSTILYRAAVSGKIDVVDLLGTHNEGQLMSPPFDIKTVQLEENNGELLDYRDGSMNWMMVYLGGSDCDDSCQQSLYLMRQVHVALGREAGRMQRTHIANTATRSEEFSTLIDNEFPHLDFLTTDNASLSQLKERVLSVNPEAQILLIDPQGWLMMVYTAKHTGNQVLSDLRFLMKYSADKA